MPYGSSDPYEANTYSLFGYNHYPSGSDFYDRSIAYLKSPQWFRSGENMPKGFSASKTRAPVTYERVPVVLKNGPKLPYKVYDWKLGRMRWAREHITVFKQKRVKPKRVVFKGSDLPPHNLQFRSSRMVVMPHSSKDAVGNHDVEGWSRQYTGNLWALTTPIGGSSSIPFQPIHSSSIVIDSELIDLTEKANEKCIRKLYAAVNNSELNLLNALAERKQTVSMLADLVKRLATALFAAKKGDLIRAAGSLFPKLSGKTPSKEIANNVLLFNYGVKPLIDDINGLVDHLNNWEPMVWDVKVSSTLRLDPRVETSKMTDGIAIESSRTTIGHVKVIWKVRVKSKDNFSRNLSRLGLTNLTATIWELIPWSHVIDWVVKIGSYLDDRDAFENLEVVSCTQTVFYKESVIYDRSIGGRDNAGYVWQEAKTQVIVDKVSVNRTVKDAPPNLPYPSPKNPFSKSHMLNALAHIRQLMKK